MVWAPSMSGLSPSEARPQWQCSGFQDGSNVKNVAEIINPAAALIAVRGPVRAGVNLTGTAGAGLSCAPNEERPGVSMSRLSGFGLAAAALLVAVMTATVSFAAPPPPGAKPIDPEMRTAGMKAAPGLIAEGKLPCTLADAREIGTGTAADKAPTTIYEIACKEGLGYVVGKETKAGVALLTYNCLMTTAPMTD